MSQQTNDALVELLKPARLTCVVDIGANPIDGDPPYKVMLRSGICHLIGFEPQPDALARLNASKSDLEIYLPYAVGDGTKGTLRICQAQGMTRLFEPDEKVLSHFPKFSEWGRIVKEESVTSHRLDDISEISSIDFLKIDVQGSELSVFQNGHERLSKTVVIQTEVSFLALYKKQPIFSEIDLELRKLGFIPHTFSNINRRMIAPTVGRDPYAAINQLLEADMVYVRDFMIADDMDSEQLKHLAIIVHHCYGSFDLTMNCIHHLIRRNAVTKDAQNHYLNLLHTHTLKKSAP